MLPGEQNHLIKQTLIKILMLIAVLYPLSFPVDLIFAIYIISLANPESQATYTI